MSSQLDLLSRPYFAARAAVIDLPRAAKADPVSSHIAAEELVESGALDGQLDRVLRAVKRWPDCTSAELAEKIAAVEGKHWRDVRSMVARRLPDLAKLFLVEQVDAIRPCLITKRKCVTWRPR